MNRWQAAAAAIREEFLESLASANFTVRSSSNAEGNIVCGGRSVPVDITIPEDFPYAPPKVRPIDGSGGFSWHANFDGSLCLWALEETGDLPWRTVESIVQRVREWFANNAAGWLDDTPDLDMERYWLQTPGLVLHPDLDGIIGKVCRISRRGGVWNMKVGPPRGSKQHGCLVLDVGELEEPLRRAEQVLESIDSKTTRGIRSGVIPILVLRYWRKGRAGILALRVTDRNPVAFRSVPAAHQGGSTMRLRSGLDRDQLAEKAVAVVGVGAIGARAADLLARAGVGSITLVDFDVVLPGNLIRHSAKESDVGQEKVDVVGRYLALGPATPTIKVQKSAISTIDAATQLLDQHNLVLDATANQTATRLLLDGGSSLGRSVVSVCLVREGQVGRVDRVPLAADEAHLPLTPDISPRARLFEGGCGDPVSPAPMWAAEAAAARAVAVCADVLTGRNEYPPTIIDVLVSGDGACGPVGSIR